MAEDEGGGAGPDTAKIPSPMIPRQYQAYLIDVATKHNVIVCLETGGGKTLVAAEVIRRKLPQLKAANQLAIFLAPTNPLAAQQADEVLAKRHGLAARAYHGGTKRNVVTGWGAEEWRAEAAELDVMVLTPDVLLHALCHAALTMSDLGLLVFDECHHCHSDHPYNQIMQDFYFTAPVEARPQVLGLTASPSRLPSAFKSSATGLQAHLDARLVTVPRTTVFKQELVAATPTPASEYLVYRNGWPPGTTPDAVGLIGEATSRLEQALQLSALGKRAELQYEAWCKESVLAGCTGHHLDAIIAIDLDTNLGRPMRVLDHQVRSLLKLLSQLGPWAAAAAVYLDLLAPRDTQRPSQLLARRRRRSSSGSTSSCGSRCSTPGSSSECGSSEWWSEEVEEVARQMDAQKAQQQEAAAEDWAPGRAAAEEQQQSQEQVNHSGVVEPAAAAAAVELEDLPNGGPAESGAAHTALELAAAAGIISPSPASAAASTPSSTGQPASEEEDALMLRGLLEEEEAYMQGTSAGGHTKQHKQAAQAASPSPDPILGGLLAGLDSPAKARGSAVQQQPGGEDGGAGSPGTAPGAAASPAAAGGGNKAMRECALHLCHIVEQAVRALHTYSSAKHLITPADLTACRLPRPAARPPQPSDSGAGSADFSALLAPDCRPGAGWVWSLRRLNALLNRVVLCEAVTAITDLLMEDGPSKDNFLRSFALQDLSPQSRADGQLQRYGQELLWQVPFEALQAQVVPSAPLAPDTPAWRGPPLVTPKVSVLVTTLLADVLAAHEQQATAAGPAADVDMVDAAAGAAAGGEGRVKGKEGPGEEAGDPPRKGHEWWASMVFVETRLGALIVARLLNSLPALHGLIAASHFVGSNPSGSGGAACEAVGMPGRVQRDILAQFSRGALNVLVCTNVGAEGMDFRQCGLVMAADPPSSVISYIQCRGRARKAGSRYLLMAPDAGDGCQAIGRLARDLEELMDDALALSADNLRVMSGPGPVPRLSQEVRPLDPSWVTTPLGARATPRLAQALLAEFCAKLPCADGGGRTLTPVYTITSSPTSEEGPCFTARLFLPANTGLPPDVELVGRGSTKSGAAKAAALMALRLLLELGKLDGRLQPTWVSAKHIRSLVAEPPRPFELQVLPQPPFQPADLDAGTQGGSSKRAASCGDEAGEQQAPGPPSVEWWLQQQQELEADGVEQEAAPDGPPAKKLKGDGGMAVELSTPSTHHEPLELACLPGTSTAAATAALVAGSTVGGTASSAASASSILLPEQLGSKDQPLSGVAAATAAGSTVQPCAALGARQECGSKRAAPEAGTADRAALGAAASNTTRSKDTTGYTLHLHVFTWPVEDASQPLSAMAGISAAAPAQPAAQAVPTMAAEDAAVAALPDGLRSVLALGVGSTLVLPTLPGLAAHATSSSSSSHSSDTSNSTSGAQDAPFGVMKFGVLLHRPIEGVEDLPSWPAWLPWVEPPPRHSPDPLQPPPVQMRVRYVGPVVLGWGQLALLLQYQDVVQRHINPRSKWVRQQAGGEEVGTSPEEATLLGSKPVKLRREEWPFGLPIPPTAAEVAAAAEAAAAEAAAAEADTTQQPAPGSSSVPSGTTPTTGAAGTANGPASAAAAVGMVDQAQEVGEGAVEAEPEPDHFTAGFYNRGFYPDKYHRLMGYHLLPPAPPPDAPTQPCVLHQAQLLLPGVSPSQYALQLGGRGGLEGVSYLLVPLKGPGVPLTMRCGAPDTAAPWGGLPVTAPRHQLPQLQLDWDVVDDAAGGVQSALGLVAAGCWGPATATAVLSMQLLEELGAAPPELLAAKKAAEAAGTGAAHPAKGLAAAAAAAQGPCKGTGASGGAAPGAAPAAGGLPAAGSTPDAAVPGAAAPSGPLVGLPAPELHIDLTTASAEVMTGKAGAEEIASYAWVQGAAAVGPLVAPSLLRLAAGLAAGPVAAAASKLLVGQLLVASHTSRMYRCVGVSPLTLASLMEDGSGTYADFFEQQYGIQGLRQDLPLLEVVEGRGARATCLSPPAPRLAVQPAAVTAAGEEGEERTGERGVRRGASVASGSTADIDGNQGLQLAAGAEVSNDAEGEVTAAEPTVPAPPLLPLELCWALGVNAGQWQHMQLVPALLYRVDTLLQLRRLVHHLDHLEQRHTVQLTLEQQEEQDMQQVEQQEPQQAEQEQQGTPEQQPEQPGAMAKPQANGVADGQGAIAAAAGRDGDTPMVDADPAAAPAPAIHAHMAAPAGEEATSEQEEGSSKANGILHLDKAACPVDTPPAVAVEEELAAQEAEAAAEEAGAPCKGGTCVAVTGQLPPAPLVLVGCTAARCGEPYDLERLEFLGDALLKILAATHLMNKGDLTTLNEGELSLGKARWVRNAALAAAAQCAGLAPLLRLTPFTTQEYSPQGLSALAALGPRPFPGKRLADAVEALLAAAYMGGVATDLDNGTAAAGATAVASTSGGTLVAEELLLRLVSRTGLRDAAWLCQVLGVLPTAPLDTFLLPPKWQRREAQPSASPTAQLLARISPAAFITPERIATTAHEVEELLGGRYTWRQPGLVLEALTHVSILGRHSYQLLEFLGDALIEAVVTADLLTATRKDGKPLTPCQMHLMRASRVSNQYMAACAVMVGLHEHVWAAGHQLERAVLTSERYILRLAAIQEAERQGKAPAGSGDTSSQEGPVTPRGGQAPTTPGTPGTPGSVSGSRSGVKSPSPRKLVRGAPGGGPRERRIGRVDIETWERVWARSSRRGSPLLDLEEEEEELGEGEVLGHPKLLADVVEALVAAVWVDSGGDWAAVFAVAQHILQL